MRRQGAANRETRLAIADDTPQLEAFAGVTVVKGECVHFGRLSYLFENPLRALITANDPSS